MGKRVTLEGETWNVAKTFKDEGSAFQHSMFIQTEGVRTRTLTMGRGKHAVLYQGRLQPQMKNYRKF